MEKGDRFNSGKLEWGLVPMKALEPMIRVLMFGKKKYDAWNWTKGLSWTQTYESMQRHLNAFMSGENDDPESGLHHIGHILCNALFLSYMIMTGKGTDDRYKYREEIKKDV